MAKDNLPVDKINQLAEILKEQDLTEIELESDNFKIKVRKEVSYATQAPVAVAQAASAASSAAPAAPVDDGLFEVKSPMVGTFYASSSPDADAFMKVGSKVNKGDTLCIVEAMKLMNELPSEASGEVVEICVSNAEAVSFGQVIAKIRQN